MTEETATPEPEKPIGVEITDPHHIATFWMLAGMTESARAIMARYKAEHAKGLPYATTILEARIGTYRAEIASLALRAAAEDGVDISVYKHIVTAPGEDGFVQLFCYKNEPPEEAHGDPG